MAAKLRWREAPTEKDYEAGERYLSLLLGRKRANALIDLLRAAPIEHYVARDLMRAANYAPFAYGDKSQRKDVEKRRPLAPLLVVRRKAEARLIIVDGYHRLGAVCELDAEADVPCKIV